MTDQTQTCGEIKKAQNIYKGKSWLFPRAIQIHKKHLALAGCQADTNQAWSKLSPTGLCHKQNSDRIFTNIDPYFAGVLTLCTGFGQ